MRGTRLAGSLQGSRPAVYIGLARLPWNEASSRSVATEWAGTLAGLFIILGWLKRCKSPDTQGWDMSQLN